MDEGKQLNDAELAFRTLKHDLSIRQSEDRVEAHVLVCFIAYAMYRTLDRLAKMKGLGMTARMVLDTLAGLKSGDIVMPLLDGRELKLWRERLKSRRRPVPLRGVLDAFGFRT